MLSTKLEPAILQRNICFSTQKNKKYLKYDLFIYLYFSYSGPSGILGSDVKQNTASAGAYGA